MRSWGKVKNGPVRAKAKCVPPPISPQQADPSQTKASVNLYFNPLGSIVFDMFNFWLTSPVRLIKTCQYLAGKPAEAPCGCG